MRKSPFLIGIFSAAILAGAATLPRARAAIDAHAALAGKTWAINFVAPISPKGNDFGQPHRHKFDFRDDDGMRSVTAREILGIIVPGVWRSAGNEFSATFEFSCDPGSTCGTVLMRGIIDSETRLSGRVVVFWDTPDGSTPTGQDTSTGSFTGEKCGSIRLAHDTGGCDAP